mgnify:CR=1 FL=1
MTSSRKPVWTNISRTTFTRVTAKTDRLRSPIDVHFYFFWKTIYRRVALPSFMEYGAQTGSGGLRKVFMHRPTEVLKRMTSVNRGE